MLQQNADITPAANGSLAVLTFCFQSAWHMAMQLQRVRIAHSAKRIFCGQLTAAKSQPTLLRHLLNVSAALGQKALRGL